ncbi:MAG: hypothetical protein R2713_16565 [Ilumatobacteraceae bacterium]
MRALLPQITRTIRTADQLVEQLTAPIERVAPGLAHLADTLSSPQLASFPTELGDVVGTLGDFVGSLGDLARRLQPLGQLAESAGGLFGLRPLASLRGGSGTRPVVAPADAAAMPQPTGTRATAKKPAAKKQAAKKPTAKKQAAKKPTAKKQAAKKPAAQQSATKQAGR